jgi:hypothetical protein
VIFFFIFGIKFQYDQTNRDIILMDFRGIGLFEPAFSPELQKDLMNLFLLNLTPDESREDILGFLKDALKT